MTLWNNIHNSRERRTILLLSAVVLFLLGYILVSPEKEDHSEPQGTTDPQPQGHTATNTAYQQKRAERNRRQEEHYRLQAEYYDQKDRFYRQEIRHYKALNAKRTHIQPETPQTDSEETSFIGKFSTQTTVDANTADSITLRRIPGIGRAISSSILRYRQLLGGFYSLQQLMECKFFTADLLPWFTLDSVPHLKKIRLNASSFYQLVRHPYISKPQTQDLLEYIRIYGPIQDSTQLSTTGIFTAAELQRLMPYLDFE